MKLKIAKIEVGKVRLMTNLNSAISVTYESPIYDRDTAPTKRTKTGFFVEFDLPANPDSFQAALLHVLRILEWDRQFNKDKE